MSDEGRARVSEVFVESVQAAALDLGMAPTFVGFAVAVLVGGAAEMASPFTGGRTSAKQAILEAVRRERPRVDAARQLHGRAESV